MVLRGRGGRETCDRHDVPGLTAGFPANSSFLPGICFVVGGSWELGTLWSLASRALVSSDSAPDFLGRFACWRVLVSQEQPLCMSCVSGFEHLKKASV